MGGFRRSDRRRVVNEGAIAIIAAVFVVLALSALAIVARPRPIVSTPRPTDPSRWLDAWIEADTVRCRTSADSDFVEVYGRVRNTIDTDISVVRFLMRVTRNGEAVAEDYGELGRALTAGGTTSFTGQVRVSGSAWDSCMAVVVEVR
ncbi:MAG TPA: hypothetical protein PLC98_24575 [Anaerolineales bacterium]|nr:hypothetical protein [Anaerolineales bacterium]